MKTFLILSARNLGDAVQHASALARLQKISRADRWVVWTFEQARFLFDDLPNTEVICSAFPMGATARLFLSRKGLCSFLSALRKVRLFRPEEALDLVGDFRERFALALLGARRCYSPEWEPGHPFRSHIRACFRASSSGVSVPASLINVYDAQKLVLQTVVSFLELGADGPAGSPVCEGNALKIGIHPLASLDFKLWPLARWVGLVVSLNRRFPGSSFILFGAPGEISELEVLAGALREKDLACEVFAAPLRDFRTRLAEIDLLFGLDSFSVHLAHSLGVRSIVLVGANDPKVFSPPSSTFVTHSGRCPVQPCGGRPKCVGRSYQYSCMADITEEDVLQAI